MAMARSLPGTGVNMTSKDSPSPSKLSATAGGVHAAIDVHEAPAGD